MNKDEWKDERFADKAEEPVCDETETDANTDEEQGVIEQSVDGVIADGDPFENAFQYTEPEQPKTSNWPIVVLALLMVAVLVGGVLWGTGAFNHKADGDGQQGGEAATVPSFGTADVSDEVAASCGDFSLSNGAFAFFMEMEYRNSDTYASYDKTQPLKNQDAAAYEQLVSSAKSQYEWMLSMNASAKANGTTLNQAARNIIEKAVSSTDVSVFRNGVSSADVREFYTLYYTAWLEESALFNGIVLSDEDVEGIYEEFSEDYETCGVANYFFVVGEDGDYATMEEAQAAADRLAACDTPEEFRAMVVQHLLDSGECETEEEALELYNTTYAKEGIGYSADYEIAQWLFADDTAVGDTKILAGEDYLSIYMLTKARSRETSPLARLRYIFLSYDAYGEEAAVQTLADEVMAAWEESDGSLDAFEALARQYTADFTTYDGDAWELAEQPSISEEASAWCFDEARQTGDVTVVTSDSGYHILCYVDTAEMWYAQVLTTAQNDAITATVEAMPDTYAVTFYDEAIQKNEL